MKLNFSKEVSYTPDFNGNKELPEKEQLKAKLKPLETLELLDLTDILKAAGFAKGEVSDMTTEQMRAVVTQAGGYIDTKVTLEGAEDFTKDDIAKFTPFLPLAVELLFTLINISSPNKDDVKNS